MKKIFKIMIDSAKDKIKIIDDFYFTIYNDILYTKMSELKFIDFNDFCNIVEFLKENKSQLSCLKKGDSIKLFRPGENSDLIAVCLTKEDEIALVKLEQDSQEILKIIEEFKMKAKKLKKSN